MPAELTLIVVEDNELLREEMVSFLNRPGWEAHGVDCGEELSLWLMQHTAQIAVLDVNLPYEDGYSIAQRLRASYPAMGIIMLTARVRHGERVAGYQAGADVYLTKPTIPAELIAVIDNLGRRLALANTPPAPRYSLDRERGLLESADGSNCLLTPAEVRLLDVLAMMPQRDADTDYLVAAMSRRGDKPMSKESLAVLISRFRNKCKQAFGLESVVIASRGIGYRLTVSLRMHAG